MAESPNVTDIWCGGLKKKKKRKKRKRREGTNCAGFSNLTLPLLPTESSPSAIKRGLGKCRVFMECHLARQNCGTNLRFRFSTNGWGLHLKPHSDPQHIRYYMLKR